MEEVSIIGLDFAKNVFQAHGAAPDGSVVFRRKLTRGQVLKFFASQPSCTVAMEACAGAHHWASAGSSGRAGRARVCKAVREAAEERYGRCRGNCGGGFATDHALRRAQDRSTAGCRDGVPDTGFAGEAAYSDNQCPAWSSSRIWCRGSGRLCSHRSLDRGDRGRKRCTSPTRGKTGCKPAWGPGADRRPKCLIYLAPVGSMFGASQIDATLLAQISVMSPSSTRPMTPPAAA
jgi:hypothetical protein